MKGNKMARMKNMLRRHDPREEVASVSFPVEAIERYQAAAIANVRMLAEEMRLGNYIIAPDRLAEGEAYVTAVRERRTALNAENARDGEAVERVTAAGRTEFEAFIAAYERQIFNDLLASAGADLPADPRSAQPAGMPEAGDA